MITLTPVAANAGIKEWVVGIGAVIGATATAVLGLPPLGVAAGATVGAAVPAVIIPDTEQTINDVIKDVPEEERASVLKAHAIWEAVESLGKWVIAVVAGFFFIPMIIGYFLPNGKQRRQKKEMIKIKEMLFDREDIKMKDIK